MLRSILDTDFYKASQQQAILQQIVKDGEDPLVAYRFTNRGGNLFTRATYEAVLQAVKRESRSSVPCCSLTGRLLSFLSAQTLGSSP